MAEVLSLVASIIALAQAADALHTGLQRLFTLRKAPQRLLDMHNKIEELRVLISVAKYSVTTLHADDHNTFDRFQRLVNRAMELVNEASSLIEERLASAPENLDKLKARFKVKKWAYLRLEPRLQDLNSRLDGVIQSLSTALNAISALYLQGLRVTLTSVHAHVLAMPKEILGLIADGNRSVRVEQLGEVFGSPDSDDQTPPTSSMEQAGTPSSSSSEARRLNLDTISTGGSPMTLSSWCSRTFADNFHDLPDPKVSNICVEATIAKEEVLNICGCSCHSPLALKTPAWLGNAIGTLLIRRLRNPQSCEKCSRKPCSNSTTKNVTRTSWYLPWWMMGRFVEFESSWNASQKLKLSLRTSRIIPDNSLVFLYAQHNNLDGMKRLFSEHLASPFDISSKGRTPLHFAATAVKSEMIEFLVRVKAETDVEDQDNLSPNDIIWELYLRKPEKRQHLLTAAGLSTSDTSSLDKQGFTGVHRIVLGLAGPIDLEEYLRANDSEIDQQDLTGKTALAWAASRIHPRPVRILLDHQASVSICDYRKKTPLHYAGGSGAPESITMILEAIGRAECERPPHNGKGLIEAGDDKHRTPLNYATRMNLLPHTILLLDHGADAEAVEADSKRSILLNAIYWNSHLVLPVLLDHGARTDVQDVNGETILHHIARFGGLETLSIMADRDLGSVDHTVTNILGLTAVDVFNSPNARCSPDGEERREIAVRLFSRILRNATHGTDRSILIIDQHPLGALETTDYLGTFEMERGDGKEDTDVEDDFSEEDEVFFDASTVL